MSETAFEVIIIGGGPAGMSAALVLGRSRIKTLVVNAETPRNLVTTHSHGFLTQDGKHPAEIFSTAKQQLEKYNQVTYLKTEAQALKQSQEGFELTTQHGEYSSRRVILATGYKDNIDQLDIRGLVDVYGKSVYPCPFCDGFELADKKLGVFGGAEMAPHFAKVIAHWSDDVVVFTNGEPVEDQKLVSSLNEKGIRVIEKEIKHLESAHGQLERVVFIDGKYIELEGGFLPDTKATEAVDFASKLKVPTIEGHFGELQYDVDDNKESKVKGLFIIGDSRVGFSGLITAAAEGSQVAAAITHQLIEERWAG